MRNHWSGQPNNSALYFENTTNGRAFTRNANVQFESASVIKIPLILYVLSILERKNNDLDTILEVKENHLSNGSGIIAWTNQRRLSVRELIGFMVKYSDCTATNSLLEFCGGTVLLNQFLASMGYTTRMHMNYTHFDTNETTMPRVGSTTATEIAKLNQELLLNHRYKKQIQQLFKKPKNPWTGRNITNKKLHCKKIFIKTESMRMIGPQNDSVLNISGLIIDKDAAYSFVSLNHFQLAPLATEDDLHYAINDICNDVCRTFADFRAS